MGSGQRRSHLRLKSKSGKPRPRSLATETLHRTPLLPHMHRYAFEKSEMNKTGQCLGHDGMVTIPP